MDLIDDDDFNTESLRLFVEDDELLSRITRSKKQSGQSIDSAMSKHALFQQETLLNRVALHQQILNKVDIDSRSGHSTELGSIKSELVDIRKQIVSSNLSNDELYQLLEMVRNYYISVDAIQSKDRTLINKQLRSTREESVLKHRKQMRRRLKYTDSPTTNAIDSSIKKHKQQQLQNY